MGRRRKLGDPKRAVAYVRVSTDEQSLGPEAQRKAIGKWCEDHGIDLVATAEDIGVSGGAEIEKRPGLMDAMNALVEHRAGVLIVHKRDRLARDVVCAGLIERLAERQGARVMSADGVANGDCPEAMLQRGITDLFAMYERQLIRARTKAGLAVKRGKGEYTGGGAPYGWAIAEDGKHLAAVPEEQAVLRTARTLRGKDMTLRAIGAELANSGMLPRSGKAWNPKTVRSLLRSRLAEDARTMGADKITDELTPKDMGRRHGEAKLEHAS